MRVRLLRALCFGSARVEPGTEIELADISARESIFRGVVEAVDVKETSAAPGPMTTESAAAVVTGKAARGARNAVK